VNWSREFSLFSGPVSFTSAQRTSSPPFSFSGAASPSADIVVLSHHVTLPSHGAKTSSLHLLYLLTTLRPAVSPLELKLKHWIYTTTAGHPPRTTRLPPSTAIKIISILATLPITQLSLFYLLSSQSTTTSKLYLPSSHAHHSSI
jgi:hypothetical protein